MFNAHDSFKNLMTDADALLARVEKRATQSKIAAPEVGTISAKVEAVNAAVQQTQIEALMALEKLAAATRARNEKRAEKVAIAQHIAKTAAKLFEE
jgi:hypothetical protein